MIRIEIPYKFPSLNDYTYKCRSNKFAGATMKRKIQQDIGYIINTLPEFKNPIKINFTWVEGNKRRDLDNVCFAKNKCFIFNSFTYFAYFFIRKIVIIIQ